MNTRTEMQTKTIHSDKSEHIKRTRNAIASIWYEMQLKIICLTNPTSDKQAMAMTTANTTPSAKITTASNGLDVQYAACVCCINGTWTRWEHLIYNWENERGKANVTLIACIRRCSILVKALPCYECKRIGCSPFVVVSQISRTMVRWREKCTIVSQCLINNERSRVS